MHRSTHNLDGQICPPYSKGQKNDFHDAEAITEAVQRPTMKLVATRTAEHLQALHRVREDRRNASAGRRASPDALLTQHFKPT
jgi:transposase